MGVSVVAWSAYVAPALHKPGQSCPDPSWGVVVSGYAAVILPPVLVAAAAGALQATRDREAWRWLTGTVACAALIALLYLQGGMLCHFGD